jgi:hypothetical protein
MLQHYKSAHCPSKNDANTTNLVDDDIQKFLTENKITNIKYITVVHAQPRQEGSDSPTWGLWFAPVETFGCLAETVWYDDGK